MILYKYTTRAAMKAIVKDAKQPTCVVRSDYARKKEKHDDKSVDRKNVRRCLTGSHSGQGIRFTCMYCSETDLGGFATELGRSSLVSLWLGKDSTGVLTIPKGGDTHGKANDL